MRDVVGCAKVHGGEHPGVSLELGGTWTCYSMLPAVPDGLSAIRVASNVSGDVSEGMSTSVSMWDALGTQGHVTGWWTTAGGSPCVLDAWSHRELL